MAAPGVGSGDDGGGVALNLARFVRHGWWFMRYGWAGTAHRAIQSRV